MRSFWDLLSWIGVRAPYAIRILAPRSESEFVDNVLVLLQNAVTFLEQNAGHHATTNEDGISDIVVAHIYRDGVNAHRERNSNGHVDIFIESTFPKHYTICGEAKLYKSYTYHESGLLQVLHYSTGRCQFGFVLEYVRECPVVDAIEVIRKGLRTNRPEKLTQGPDDWPGIPFGLCTIHDHTAGSGFKVLHLGVNMNVTPLAAKKRSAAARKRKTVAKPRSLRL